MLGSAIARRTPINKVTSYRIKILEVYDPTDYEGWLEFRARHDTVPTSSVLTASVGHGYSSINSAYEDRLNMKVKKVSPYDFTEMAKKHGTTMEPKAKQAFRNFAFGLKAYLGETQELTECIENDTSQLIEITEVWNCFGNEEGLCAKMICTPDAMYKAPYGNLVVEFKAPYSVVVRRGDKTILEAIKTDFLTKNPYGGEYAFTQAATYSLVRGAKKFITAYYFTNTFDEEYLVIYAYEGSNDLYQELFGHILKCNNELQHKKKHPTTKYRLAKNTKVKITEMMENHFVLGPIIYDVLQKEYFFYGVDEKRFILSK